MTGLFSIFSTIGYLFGLFWMRVCAGSTYEDVDPSIVDPDRDDWQQLLIVVFILTLATQAPFLFSKYRKYHAALMIIAAALFFWMRQW